MSNARSIADAGHTLKAWINFDGGYTGGDPVIKSSFNVQDITDHGTGQYSINFINDMSNADYSVQVSVKGDIDFDNANGVARISFINSLSTGSVHVHTGYMAQATRDYSNFPIICVAVFGS